MRDYADLFPDEANWGRHRISPASQSNGVSWLISFGDLLTLLVCFFLLLTPETRPNASEVMSNQEVSLSSSSLITHGTDLASKRFDSGSKVLPLWGGEPGDGSTTRVSLTDAFKRIASDGAVSIRLCSGVNESDVISSALEELPKLGTLAQRARFDLGFDCRDWRERFGPEGKLLAVVSY